MSFTADQLNHLRDNLDGLGYAMGPRGLFGIGNEQNAFDAAALGGGSLTANNSMRSVTTLDAYTRAAIFQFQYDRKLPANGEFGQDLVDRVDMVVRNLQNNLKIVLKKSDFPLTGYYGLETFQAVKDYQKLKGLPITGIAPAAIQRQLDNDARQAIGSPIPQDPGEVAQAIVTKLMDTKSRYQNGLIITDDFVREVIQALPTNL